MYLVTQGKRRENQLGFDPKTNEYVYIHKGNEEWRKKGDRSLLDYFNAVRAVNGCSDDEVLECNPIYSKYSESCHRHELEEYKRLFGGF